MRHDLFETCIRNEDISIDFVTASAENIVCRHAENLVGCNIEESEVLNELMQILPQIKSFFNAYTNIVGSQSGSILVGPTCMSTSIHLQIKGAHATEQKIVVPELGMKGIIDATLDALVGSTHSYKPSQKRTGAQCMQLCWRCCATQMMKLKELRPDRIDSATQNEKNERNLPQRD